MIPLDGLLIDASPVGGQPRPDAQHIAVHGRLRQTEADRADRAGGVVTDSGERTDILVSAREFAAVFCHDLLRGLLQIASAAVIAEPLPELHQHIMTASGERSDIRQRRQKPRIIWLDGLHSGLLEHDLREPDMIRLTVSAPRQIARILREPFRQQRRDPVQLFQCLHSAR